MTPDLLAKIDLNKKIIAWLKAIGVALQAA